MCNVSHITQTAFFKLSVFFGPTQETDCAFVILDLMMKCATLELHLEWHRFKIVNTHPFKKIKLDQ